MLTIERPSDAPVEAEAGLIRRLWARPLWAHVLVYALMLLALLPLMRVELPFTTDEGLYGLQAEQLRDGRWDYPYRLADIDPDGRWFPYDRADRAESRFFPLAKRPLYSSLLSVTTRLVGDAHGLVVFSVLGALAAAAAAWLVAAEIASGASRRAFWIVAVGPVAVHSSLVWAHAPSAAIAGFAVLLAVRIARRPVSTLAMTAFALLCAAGVLIRAEGLLLAGAVAAPLAVTVGRRRGAARGLAVGAVAAGAAVAALAVEGRWVETIHGGQPGVPAVRASGGVGYLPGRITGAWHSLLQGAYDDPLAALCLAAATVAIVLAGLAARRPARLAAAAPLLWAAAGLVVLRLAVAPDDPVPGLVAAWPVALVGLLWLRRLSPDQAVVACIAGLFATSILLTQYPEGGGLEWGGRFFAPLLTSVAALASVGLGWLRRAAFTPVVVLALLPLLLGFNAVRDGRVYGDRVVDDVVAWSTEIVVTDADALPLFAWRHDAAHQWLLVPADERPEALEALHRRGVTELTLVVAADGAADTGRYGEVSDVTTSAIAGAGLRMLVVSEPG